MHNIQITDAEQEIIKVLWSNPAGMTSAELREKLDKSWERTTVLTLLSRLSEKGAVLADRENRPTVFRSLISKEEYTLSRTRSLLKDLYSGSVGGMMAALCASGDLTEEDVRDLQELLDKGAK